MIDQAVRLLRNELWSFIDGIQQQESFRLRGIDPLGSNEVALSNIAKMDDGETSELADSIIITLVNVEEESTLKNGRNYQRSSNGSLSMVEPPVHLNLYLLFSAVPAETGAQDVYEVALTRLSLVIEFFQSNRVFTNTLSQVISDSEETSEVQIPFMRLQVELYTLTFEQLNHLWGSLGGKQVPSVMYKVRLVRIQGSDPKPLPVIEEIDSQSARR